MKTLQEIKGLVSEARDKAKYNSIARQYPCIFSRGTYLCTLDKAGQCDPAPEGECPDWDGTQRSIDRLVADVEANYPKVTEIYISGGYDGADSPHAYHTDGDYDPWVSSWDVCVWERNP